jgi:subtilisin family serine protease
MLHVLSAEIDMCDLSKFPYHFYPAIYTLCSTASLEKSGVVQIQRNPNFSLYGQGVLVGVIDTGIEYQHQAFRNSDNTTRIVSIWDQTINAEDVPPSPNLLYGTEYSSDLINQALQSNTPLEIVPSTDEIGHGTMIAGIIAGNENTSEAFSGVVPQAQLVVVKLKQAKKKNRQIHAIRNDVICYQDTDIITGVRYIYDTARRLQRPLAICIALGSNQGGHDGRSALSNYLSIISQVPRVDPIIAVGNEGNSQRHYFGTIPAGTESFRTFQLNVSEKDSMFAFEIWQSAPYRLLLGITSPSGETIEDVYPRLNQCRRINFIFETTVMWVNNIISESVTGDQLILIRFSKPMPGIWTFRVTNIDNQASSFHAWLPSGDIISNETYFLESNPNTTLTAPSPALYPLSITAYNQENNSILLTSGRGFTRTDIVKPDLAAPGFNLTCPILGNQYGTLTGTGAAAAHATGIVAMVFEWAVIKGNYTTIAGTDVNSLLIRGARRSNNIVYPNTTWGYGEINIVGFFEKLQ